MDYKNHINEVLRPRTTQEGVVLDLFAGCGGLSLGFEAAGFRTLGYEMDKAAAQTYKRNLLGACINQKLDLDTQYPATNIIIGGPPCQPFSLGGNQKGIEDSRDGFPIFIDAVRKLQPKIFIFENVKGLLISNKYYFNLIIHELSKLGYFIEYKILNAVDFGVPQNRERLFVVGHRSHFKFPPPLLKKVTVQDAIGDTMLTSPNGSKFLNEAQDRYIKNYEQASACVNPRDLHPERPARTLTCRNLSGATGDMQRVCLGDGRRRRVLICEARRLQSFPDWYEFEGSETQVFNQIGNAVPPLLAFHVANSVKDCLNNSETHSPEQIVELNTPPNRLNTLF